MRKNLSTSDYIDTPEEAKTDGQVLSMLYDMGLDLDDFHAVFMDDMKTAFGIYENDKDAHYGLDADGKSIYKKIEADGRPANIKNIAFPLINLVHGIQMDSRYKASAKAFGGEDVAVAEGTSMGIEHVSKQNSLGRRGSLQFLHKLICGRGWLVVNQEFDERDVFGTKTVIRNEDPAAITYDRKSMEPDLSDADYCRYKKIINRGLAKLLWPDKIYEINAYFDYLDSELEQRRLPDSQMTMLRMNVVVSEFYYRTWVMKKYLLEPETGVIVDASQIEEEKIFLYKQQIPSLRVIRRPGRQMMMGHTVGNPGTGLLLSRGKSKFKHNYFPYIPDFAYRSREKDFGLVRPILDQIRESNKRSSQILNYLNEMPRTRIITDDPELAMKFENDEEIISAKKGSKWTIVQPSPFPDGLARLVIASGEDAKIILNVTDDLKGVRKGNDSGAVVDSRKQSALSAINSLFDNHMGSVELRTRVIMAMNRQYMSPAKLERIMGEKAAPEVISNIKARDTEEYDLSISLTPQTPGLRWENFQKIREMRSEFPEVISPRTYVEASDVPQKDEILSEIDAQEQAMLEQINSGQQPGVPQ